MSDPKHLKDKKKKKGFFGKFVVLFVILSNVVFTAVVLYIFLKIGAEPTTLIISWFAFTTGELWALAGIRKNKLNNGKCDTETKDADASDNKPDL